MRWWVSVRKDEKGLASLSASRLVVLDARDGSVGGGGGCTESEGYSWLAAAVAMQRFSWPAWRIGQACERFRPENVEEALPRRKSARADRTKVRSVIGEEIADSDSLRSFRVNKYLLG